MPTSSVAEKRSFNLRSVPFSSPVTIDFDATPFIPEGWEIRPEDQPPNAVTGQLEFNPRRLGIYLAGELNVEELKAELADVTVLKANLLDYLLANPDLVAIGWHWWREEFEEDGFESEDDDFPSSTPNTVYFPGTIFHAVDVPDPRNGTLYIRGMRWDYHLFRWIPVEKALDYWEDCNFRKTDSIAILNP